jgi:hypothetical protein
MQVRLDGSGRWAPVRETAGMSARRLPGASWVKRFTGRGAAALAVEDPSDGGAVVVGGEPGEQRDRVVVGADR